MARDISPLLEILGDAERLLIVVHDNPDPDSIASASALARIAEAKADVPSRICCEGIIGRAENRALARELRLKLMSASRVNWRRWPVVALVDTQPGTGNNSFPRRMVPEIVIDHHPVSRKTRAKYVDVRPDYGACATILTEYLSAAGVAPSADLAAALCYAISSETQDLAREATRADMEAYLNLYPHADKRMLGRILHPKLKHRYYATLTRAILSGFTYANIIGSHLGEVEHPDFVSLVADLLLRHERMGWSIVTGVWRGELHVSLRTQHKCARAGYILRRVLGTRGRAGGHDTMAGGRIPLDRMTPDDRRRLPTEIVMRFIRVLKRRDGVALKPLLEEDEMCSPSVPVERRTGAAK